MKGQPPTLSAFSKIPLSSFMEPLGIQGPIDFYDTTTLICPGCEGLNLHQHSVEVLFRYEDSSDAMTAEVSLGGVKVGNKTNCIKGNTGRRDIVRIYFYCESCHSGPLSEGEEEEDGNMVKMESDINPEGAGASYDPMFVLVIGQHKGSTYLGWDRSIMKYCK